MVGGGSGGEERVKRIEREPVPRLGLYSHKGRCVKWPHDFQLILQKQETKTKADEELALGTFPENLRKILNFNKLRNESVLCSSKWQGDPSYTRAYIFIARY